MGRFWWFTLLAALSSAALAQNTRASHRPIASQELVIAYWITEPGWDTQLEVGNNLASETVSVSPLLRVHTGDSIALPAITLPPSAVRTIDLADAILRSGHALSPTDAFGALELRYQAHSMRNVYAAVLIQRPGHAINFHFDASALSPAVAQGNFEAIWWLPRQTAQGYVIIANHSAQPVRAHELWTNATGQERYSESLMLAPHETRRFSVRDIAEASKFDTTAARR
jgi:hypothetical protein